MHFSLTFSGASCACLLFVQYRSDLTFSYDLTPVRKVYTKSQSEENYDIGDMNSDDSTDDEEAPRKKIPKWAQGMCFFHYNYRLTVQGS